jgi:hypothetical protein
LSTNSRFYDLFINQNSLVNQMLFPAIHIKLQGKAAKVKRIF